MREEVLRELLEEEEEARKVREESANWEYIKELPPRLRIALEIFIKTGDLWRAAKFAEMKLEEFDELRRRAGVVNA
jgi:hypothetical protein